jgi:uncharacterized protein (TIRG00374 family)
MKRLHSVLLVLGMVFLGYLLWRIGVRELWRELSLLGWGLVPLVLSEGVIEMIHTLGWRRCLSGPQRALPFVLLFRIRMAGYAINYLTPTATLGGEVTRATLLSSYGHAPQVVSGLLVDKACIAVAHLLWVLVGAAVILWQVKLPAPLEVAMVVAALLLAAGIAAFLLVQIYGKLGAVIRWLAQRKIGGSRLQAASGQVTAVDEAFRVFYRERPWDLAVAVCWHLAAFPIGILQTWLFFSFLGAHASFAVAVNVWFLGLWFDLLTFAVPFNLGTLEGGRVVAFTALGYPAVEGMTYGMTLRLALLFLAGFGLINYVLLAARPALAGPEQAAAGGERPPEPKLPGKPEEIRARVDAGSL